MEDCKVPERQGTGVPLVYSEKMRPRRFRKNKDKEMKDGESVPAPLHCVDLQTIDQLLKKNFFDCVGSSLLHAGFL